MKARALRRSGRLADSVPKRNEIVGGPLSSRREEEDAEEGELEASKGDGSIGLPDPSLERLSLLGPEPSCPPSRFAGIGL